MKTKVKKRYKLIVVKTFYAADVYRIGVRSVNLVKGLQVLKRTLVSSFLHCSQPIHSDFSRYAFLLDHLTDLCTGKSKNKFVKNCPKSGLNPGPPNHHSNALLTVLPWYILARRFLK